MTLPRRVESTPRPVLAAAVLTAVEALGLLGVCVLYVRDILAGEPADRGLALFGAGLGLALALALAGLAAGLSRARRPALAPVVLVQLLMLPVGWGLLQGHRYVPAVLVLGLALAVLGALFGSERSRSSFS